MHNKELLVIFEVFKSWQHFLEGLAAAIDTVTDHKNLEYFTSTKKLTRQQARWLSQPSPPDMEMNLERARLGPAARLSPQPPGVRLKPRMVSWGYHSRDSS